MLLDQTYFSLRKHCTSFFTQGRLESEKRHRNSWTLRRRVTLTKHKTDRSDWSGDWAPGFLSALDPVHNGPVPLLWCRTFGPTAHDIPNLLESFSYRTGYTSSISSNKKDGTSQLGVFAKSVSCAAWNNTSWLSLVFKFQSIFVEDTFCKNELIYLINCVCNFIWKTKG